MNVNEDQDLLEQHDTVNIKSSIKDIDDHLHDYRGYFCGLIIITSLITIVVALQFTMFVLGAVEGYKQVQAVYPQIKQNVLDFEKKAREFSEKFENTIQKVEATLNSVNKNIDSMDKNLSLLPTAFSTLIECSCKGTQCICGGE